MEILEPITGLSETEKAALQLLRSAANSSGIVKRHVRQLLIHELGLTEAAGERVLATLHHKGLYHKTRGNGRWPWVDTKRPFARGASSAEITAEILRLVRPGAPRLVKVNDGMLNASDDLVAELADELRAAIPGLMITVGQVREHILAVGHVGQLLVPVREGRILFVGHKTDRGARDRYKEAMPAKVIELDPLAGRVLETLRLIAPSGSLSEPPYLVLGHALTLKYTQLVQPLGTLIRSRLYGKAERGFWVNREAPFTITDATGESLPPHLRSGTVSPLDTGCWLIVENLRRHADSVSGLLPDHAERVHRGYSTYDERHFAHLRRIGFLEARGSADWVDLARPMSRSTQ